MKQKQEISSATKEWEGNLKQLHFFSEEEQLQMNLKWQLRSTYLQYDA